MHYSTALSGYSGISTRPFPVFFQRFFVLFRTNSSPPWRSVIRLPLISLSSSVSMTPEALERPYHLVQKMRENRIGDSSAKSPVPDKKSGGKFFPPTVAQRAYAQACLYYIGDMLKNQVRFDYMSGVSGSPRRPHKLRINSSPLCMAPTSHT